jgi:hypothetical protein
MKRRAVSGSGKRSQPDKKRLRTERVALRVGDA